WTILPATEKHAWRGEWLRMLRMVRTVVPRYFFVIVLADRGLYARWLFQRLVRLGWHQYYASIRAARFVRRLARTISRSVTSFPNLGPSGSDRARRFRVHGGA